MRSRYWLLLLALGPVTAFAWGDGCKLRADRAGGVDAKGVEKVVVRTGAGDMKVIGRGNAVRIEARGVACAAKQELLDAAQISVRREGNVVYVETNLPQNQDGWTFGNNEYAYIDIGIALPSSIPVDATDSSGDADFEDLKALTLQDSSGDVSIHRIAGRTHRGELGHLRLDVGLDDLVDLHAPVVLELLGDLLVDLAVLPDDEGDLVEIK